MDNSGFSPTAIWEMHIYYIANKRVHYLSSPWEAGVAQWSSASLVIERSWVRVPARVVGEFSSPGSTFCAGCYFGIRSNPVLTQ